MVNSTYLLGWSCLRISQNWLKYILLGAWLFGNHETFKWRPNDSTMQIPGLYVYVYFEFLECNPCWIFHGPFPHFKIYPQNVGGFFTGFLGLQLFRAPRPRLVVSGWSWKKPSFIPESQGGTFTMDEPWVHRKKKCCAHVYRPKLSECQWNVWFFFLKWWLSPTTRKKHPTKNHQHFGVEIGETHHFRKHPLLPYQTFLLRAENGKFHGGIRNTKKQRTRRVWKINQRAYKTNALQRSQPKSKRNISSTWRGEWC